MYKVCLLEAKDIDFNDSSYNHGSSHPLKWEGALGIHYLIRYFQQSALLPVAFITNNKEVFE